jgi:hypothetical protein
MSSLPDIKCRKLLYVSPKTSYRSVCLNYVTCVIDRAPLKKLKPFWWCEPFFKWYYLSRFIDRSLYWPYKPNGHWRKRLLEKGSRNAEFCLNAVLTVTYNPDEASITTHYDQLFNVISFFNRLLFASCINTFSKCCEITTTKDMKRSAQ